MPRPSRALIALCFAMLGFHVGVRAVQLSDLVVALGLSPVELGIASTAGVLTGIVTLIGGGFVIDRIGRRPLLVAGFAGAGAAFAATSAVGSVSQFLVANVALGVFVSFIDLGVNAVGSDFERASDTHAMTGFHAWFSLGAAVGAALCACGLAVGIGFRPAFLLLGVFLTTTALAVARGSLPPASRPLREALGPAEASRSSRAVEASPSRFLAPLVLLAAAIVFLCFFGDGILETFLSTYLRVFTHDAVLAGAVVAGFHASSWGGRIAFQRALSRMSARAIVMTAGVVAAASTVAGLYVAVDWLAVACFAVVGFALSPIVPLGMSLAGRAAPPGSSGRAAGFVTTVGYAAFILSPVTAGAVAEHAGMRAAVALSAVTMGLVALLGLCVRAGRVATANVSANDARVPDTGDPE